MPFQVKYCGKYNVKFLAQSGGVGWAKFNMTNGVLINIAPLSQMTISADKTKATIGGGVTVRQAIETAGNAGVFVYTGNCNCVGLLGAIMGGGYGNLMGKYGMGVDQLLSFNLVTADGELRTITPTSNPDLFWAVRGAGPNFGIVTSATIKAYPTAYKDRTAFNMVLTFGPEKLKQVVQAVENLRPKLLPSQNVFLYFINTAPDNIPVIQVTGFLLQATAEEGRAAFAGIFDVGPIPEQSQSGVTPWEQWNFASDTFCIRSGRKPSQNIGVTKLHVDQWQELWDLYMDFRNKPTAAFTTMIIEIYNLNKVRSVPQSSSAFAHRDVNAQAVLIPWYNDPALDADALAFGKKWRSILASKETKSTAYVFLMSERNMDSMLTKNRYANFAHGNEGLQAIYDESLPRLKELKKKWDPQRRFSQWFPIQ